MKHVCFLLVFISISFLLNAQKTEVDTFYSTHVKDKFIITVRKPTGFSATKKYHHVYITDGGIGIGDYVLGKSDSWKAVIPSSCIIIAISHIGDWHDKRPRDFIPSDSSKNSTDIFGRADRFYLFMKNELIPKIEKKLPNKKDRSLIGHSFGGLFCLYTLLKPDKLFNRHFAISPSLWANYYELDKLEKQFSKTNIALNANVILYAGGLEFLNKVLYSTRNFYNTMLKRKYTGLAIKKVEIGNANHLSIRKPVVDRVFELLKD